MKAYLEIILLIVAVIAFGYLFFYSADILLSPNTPQNLENQVCFGSDCFYVKLAKTNAEKEKGLMFVKQMDLNNGMLFIFDQIGVYPFWMENTLIPLDIVWIDQNQKVVFIAQDVQPCKTFICPITNASVKAKYVLEINGGVSKKIGLKIGDTAEFRIK